MAYQAAVIVIALVLLCVACGVIAHRLGRTAIRVTARKAPVVEPREEEADALASGTQLVREFAVLQQGRPHEQRSGHEPRCGSDRRAKPVGGTWFERRKDTATAKVWRQGRCRRIRTNTWNNRGDRRGERPGGRSEKINLCGRRSKNRRKT